MFVDGGEVDKKFFQEGDPGNAAYIIESGSVGIFKSDEGEDVQLATMNIGELFGEMAIIYGSKRMTHAVAMLAKQAPMVKTLIQILAVNLRTVHEVYMKRPCSAHDFFNAITLSYGRAGQKN
jgi:CRP-like cAMP-binding protein